MAQTTPNRINSASDSNDVINHHYLFIYYLPLFHYLIRYKENAIKISRILKSRQRTPRDIAVDWIEYVAITNGAHHLKVEGEELWLYQYYNIDVLLFVVAILYLLYRVIKLAKNLLFYQTSKSKND